MVEPFGCVVMLHWCLPRLRSSRFQLPFPFALTYPHTHAGSRHGQTPPTTAAAARRPPPTTHDSPVTSAYGCSRPPPTTTAATRRASLKRNVIVRRYIITRVRRGWEIALFLTNVRAYFFALLRDCIVRRYHRRLLNDALVAIVRVLAGQFTRLLPRRKRAGWGWGVRRT